MQRQRYYLALFHFQQAAEKALKAFLYANGEEEVFTHSIFELLRACSAYDKEFKKCLPLKTLDRYYITTRYPNALPGGIPAEFFDEEDEAKSARDAAHTILELVRVRL
jgi:HEPN domain-containing protein